MRLLSGKQYRAVDDSDGEEMIFEVLRRCRDGFNEGDYEVKVLASNKYYHPVGCKFFIDPDDSFFVVYRVERLNDSQQLQSLQSIIERMYGDTLRITYTPALIDCYIEMALQTWDKKWFDELMQRKSVYANGVL